jgi:simple sugar transport system ATP-binding protein
MLDEPTSALAVRQAGTVMKHIRSARDRGQAVVLITHNFRHALEIADDFVVLGHGRVIGRFSRGEVNLEKLVDLVSEEHLNSN